MTSSTPQTFLKTPVEDPKVNCARTSLAFQQAGPWSSRACSTAEIRSFSSATTRDSEESKERFSRAAFPQYRSETPASQTYRTSLLLRREHKTQFCARYCPLLDNPAPQPTNKPFQQEPFLTPQQHAR